MTTKAILTGSMFHNQKDKLAYKRWSLKNTPYVIRVQIFHYSGPTTVKQNDMYVLSNQIKSSPINILSLQSGKNQKT